VCAGILDFSDPQYHDFAMLMALLPLAEMVSGKTKRWLKKMKQSRGYIQYEAMGIPLTPMIPEETVAVYYHTACKGFTGRATAAIMILEHAGQAYELLDCDAIDPSSPVFAPPMIQVGGETISQAPCIHKTLGEMTGLAPKGYVKQHRAFQVALDAADILSESLAGKFEGDEGEARAGKWLDHVEALVCAGILDFKRPGYHDFAMLMALLQMSQLLSTLDSSQKGLWPLRHRPLRIWLRQMKLTKGYVAYEAMDLPFLPGDEGASKLEIGEPVPLPAKKRGCKAPSCMLM